MSIVFTFLALKCCNIIIIEHDIKFCRLLIETGDVPWPNDKKSPGEHGQISKFSLNFQVNSLVYGSCINHFFWGGVKLDQFITIPLNYSCYSYNDL